MKREDPEALRQSLAALKDEVPPMPEGLHQRWMNAVEESPMQDTPIRTPRPWKRILAAAAAAVFVIGGTILTRDLNIGAPSRNTAKDSGYAIYAEEDRYAADDAENGAGGMMLKSASYTSNDETSYAAYGANSDDTMEQKIIRNVTLRLGTRDYDTSLAALRAACEEAGGNIASITESGSNVRNATMTLHIPAENLDAFLEGTGAWGRVIRRSESSEDVTESYYDTKARLETQQALMARLKELVEKAQDLSDVLALESQMADTQYEIDRLTGILQNTDRKVSYATVDVSLQEEKAADDAENTELTLGQRLSGALHTGAEAFVGFLSDAAVFLTCALPFLAVVAVAAIVIRLVRKKRKQ